MQLNCCKSWGCKNFGVTESDDYEYHSNHLGYPALFCRQCGSYPPLIDNEQVESLVTEKRPQQLYTAPEQCPQCGILSYQRYGVTSANRQRVRCNKCQKIYTPPKPPSLALLQAIGQVVLTHQNHRKACQKLGINSKRFYEIQHWLAALIGRWSRKLEYQYLGHEFIALQSESAIVTLNSGIRIWLITSAEASSGYQLLTNHNLSNQFEHRSLYQGNVDNRLSLYPNEPLTEALKKRYRQLMNRYHFEYLQYGPSPRWQRYPLIDPNPIIYAHFQLLRLFNHPFSHEHHYLEQESCFRGAALMSCMDKIASQQAEVFYLFAHPDQQTAFLADGRPLGWWRDRWFNTPFGGYCPITERRQYRYPFQMRDIQANHNYFDYLDHHLNKALRSLPALDDQLIIYRCCYNLVHFDQNIPAGQFLSMPLYSNLDELTAAALDDYHQTIRPTHNH